MFIVNKENSAKAQLQSAITLWFLSGDPVSTHTLAVAANDCYQALSKHLGMSSPWKAWFDSKSRRVQDEIRYAEEFFKHGKKDLLGKAWLDPEDTDMRIFDSIRLHEHVFKQVTPLFRCWWMRFAYERPDDAELSAIFKERFRVLINHSPDVSRSEFFHKIHPVLCEEAGQTR